MITRLIVSDQNDALEFFVDKLHLQVLEDRVKPNGKRWLLLGGGGIINCEILLAQETSMEERSVIGRQGGGKTFIFIKTVNFQSDHADMVESGIEFLGSPKGEDGQRAVKFRDLCGNIFELYEGRI